VADDLVEIPESLGDALPGSLGGQVKSRTGSSPGAAGQAVNNWRIAAQPTLAARAAASG